MTEAKLNYVKGDATVTEGAGNKFIIHVCNNVGAWGSGFVIALSRKWEQPEEQYRNIKTYNLGDIQKVPVEENLSVINMIAQNNIMSKMKDENDIPLRYDALKTCLSKVCDLALKENATIHAPQFGTLRAGGDWNKIEKIILEELVGKGVSVTVYLYVEKTGSLER